MEDLVARYGYLAVFLGTVFEAETMLVVGGFAAHQGWLRLDLVMLAGICGSVLGDQAVFWLARANGPAWLACHPRLELACQRTLPLLNRWGDLFAMVFRFVYGLRTVGPMLIGLGPMAPARFALLNGLGAILWVTSVAILGALFGHVLEATAGRPDSAEARLAALVGLAAAVFTLAWLRRRWIRRG